MSVEKKKPVRVIPEAERQAHLALVRKMLGDPQAFNDEIHKIEKGLFRQAMGVLHNEDKAEQAVQTAYVKAWKNLSKFQGNSSFLTWVTRIAVNESMQILRQERTGINSITESLDNPVEGIEGSVMQREIPSGEQSPLQQILRAELREKIERGITKLSDKYREPFLRIDVHQFSYEETAEELGLSVSAVKSRMVRARRAMRQHMAKEEGIRPVFVSNGSRTSDLVPAS